MVHELLEDSLKELSTVRAILYPSLIFVFWYWEVKKVIRISMFQCTYCGACEYDIEDVLFEYVFIIKLKTPLLSISVHYIYYLLGGCITFLVVIFCNIFSVLWQLPLESGILALIWQCYIKYELWTEFIMETNNSVFNL